LWLFGIGRSYAGDKPGDLGAITILHDIRYREGPSRQSRLNLMVRNDPSGKPRPAVVAVQHGGWREGDRSRFASREHV
jgi:hypothetical protein